MAYRHRRFKTLSEEKMNNKKPISKKKESALLGFILGIFILLSGYGLLYVMLSSFLKHATLNTIGGILLGPILLIQMGSFALGKASQIKRKNT